MRVSSGLDVNGTARWAMGVVDRGGMGEKRGHTRTRERVFQKTYLRENKREREREVYREREIIRF